MKTRESKERADVYERITQQIIEAIERGTDQWRMPWHQVANTATPINVASRKRYRGINILALWASADEHGYQSGLWGTYAQWQELGAQVRKGEKSTCVVFWKFGEYETETDNGDTETKQSILARSYSVFNAQQVDGFTAPLIPSLPPVERNAEADAFFKILGADLRHGGNRAYYHPASDSIQIPPFELFKEATAYYATLAHEHVHWTAAPQRLNRNLTGRFGSEAYAAEELIAELGAAFLCADLGLANEPRPDHAAYVQNWLTVMRNDKRAIFTAASKAQAAVDWINAQEPHSQCGSNFTWTEGVQPLGEPPRGRKSTIVINRDLF